MAPRDAAALLAAARSAIDDAALLHSISSTRLRDMGFAEFAEYARKLRLELHVQWREARLDGPEK